MQNNRLSDSFLKQIVFIWIPILVLVLVYSCANKGYPEGGPKDETPPHIVKEEPVSFNTGFKQKTISIYFDEFVQLKGINEKFIISPPQAKKPKVRLRGKYIVVEFQDTLRENTTYNLDFADAIVDNNESNPLGYYRYVFSTGEAIDSLELSGHVVDAETNKPVYNTNVFLYDVHAGYADSVPLKEIPNYMATTDSAGFFRLTNLNNREYRIVAVKDDSRDYKYSPEVERMAFLDTVIHPVAFPIVRTDTLENDSVVTAEYVAYGPNNLYLRMFEEKLTQLYMLSEERLEPEWLRFIFSVPMENDFEIELLDSVKHENWYIKEQSVGKDTINIWIKDTIVYKRDSLKFAFSYLRSDTNNMYTTYHDTSRFVFKSKTKLSQSKKKKKDDEEGVKDVSRKIAIVTNQSSTQDINKGIAFVFDRPIIGDSIRNIRLEEKVDTLYYERKFDIKQDSIYLRTYRMSYKWKPEAEYRLTIDSAAIRDMYGSVNTEFVRNFKINSTEDYGKLMLHLSGVSGQVIVQLYPSGNKVELGNKEMKITYERVIDQDGAIEFDYITPGKYRIRIIQDDNRNGKWDTGLYLKNKQPEQIYYLPQEFEIRKNFDIEQEFDLKQGDVGVSERKIEK